MAKFVDKIYVACLIKLFTICVICLINIIIKCVTCLMQNSQESLPLQQSSLLLALTIYYGNVKNISKSTHNGGICWISTDTYNYCSAAKETLEHILQDCTVRRVGITSQFHNVFTLSRPPPAPSLLVLLSSYKENYWQVIKQTKTLFFITFLIFWRQKLCITHIVELFTDSEYEGGL